MEIGYPTDVKHVAHIGWDSPTGSAASPSWVHPTLQKFTNLKQCCNKKNFLPLPDFPLIMTCSEADR